MIKAAIALLGSNLSLLLLRFGRNILIARLLTVENFGLAATFAIISSVIDMVGVLGLDRLLVQASDGNEPRMQAALHSLKLMRGTLMALGLLLAAGPLAEIMGTPELAPGFRLMALIPLLQGLGHLDISRAQRTMNFMPFVKVAVGTEVLGLAALYPLYLIFGDYRVVLFAMILQQILGTVWSHAMAERGYRLGFDQSVYVRAFRFGWPLLINAILMLGIFQGDRLIVANQLGPVDLGLFSLAFMLTFMPTGILARTISRLFLPKLAPVQDQPVAFDRLGRVVVQAGLLLGLAVAAGFSLFGPDLVLIVYGQKYAGALGVLILLAVMQGIRVAKMGVSVVAIARGETRSPMIANLLRVVSLPLAWFAVARGGGVETVVWIAIVGEACGLVVAMFLLNNWHGVSVRALARPGLAWGGVLILIGFDAVLFPPRPVVFGNFHVLQGVIVLAAAGAVFFGMHDLRDWVIGRWRHGQAVARPGSGARETVAPCKDAAADGAPGPGKAEDPGKVKIRETL